MTRKISKILVANRGAIARRVIRTCSLLGIESVAVFSEADAQAPYLAEASQAYPLAGVSPQDTYLNQQALLDVASNSGADAVHPGYGFLAENAGFAQRVIDQGLIFIGPQPNWLAQMGDKVAARSLMQQHRFPVFGGSPLLNNLEEAGQLALDIGYPVMVKPTGGGGGMGMEVVHEPEHLYSALQRAQTIAANAFADHGVYLEKFIERPRHIEFQVLADGRGHAQHLFERECSVQRRNQKLIEETPAPNIDRTLVTKTAELAAGVCAQLGYDNIGTLETLFTANGEVGFLEMNTRIQVEHAVTEMVTGCDLVQQQIALAQGAELPAAPTCTGYAMEVRLYAEDSQTLLPSTGPLSVFRPPQLHGVRVETGYQQGQIITPHYDAMLAKLIAYGDTREMAIGRLVVALQAFEVVGVKTNAQLLRRILTSEAFGQGEIDTTLVERVMGGS